MHSDSKITNPLRGIQALRALAALAVVAYHAGDMLRTRAGAASPPLLSHGAAGVDLFFVISGFVMVVASRQLRGRRDAALAFLRARLRRIVPLYWLCSAAKLTLVLAVPALRPGLRHDFAYVAGSFLFLPVHDAAGFFRPLLPVGWTLSFEMLFYTLFATALAARLSPVMVVPPVLLALTLLPHTAWAISELTNPVVLEFAFGTTLAALWLRGYRLPPSAAWPLAAAASVALCVLPSSAGGVRHLGWGVPAACLVAATVSLESRIAARLPRLLLRLGDASYAIYLTHGFMRSALAPLLPHLPGAFSTPQAFVPLMLAASAAFGWVVHVAIEKPLLRARAPGVATQGPLNVTVLAGGGLSPLSGGVGILLGNLQNVWAQSESAPLLRIIDTRGAGGRAMAVLKFFAACTHLVWLGLRGRTQLVHAHMTTRGSAARKTILCGLAMAMGIPVIIHMHGADFFPFFRRLPAVLRAPLCFVLARARHVVVLGQAWRDFLVREVGVQPHRISIVPNGVPHCREPLPQPRETPKILFLGRLCARKGVPELIAALASPELRCLPWHATIAGDGNAAPYRAMLNWHRLNNRVSVPGWSGRAETARLLSRADMLVLPSYHEAMPLAVLEAMAAGVPVIATPVGCLPDILHNEMNALLVPPGEPAALAQAITRLLRDEDLRLRLIQAGYATFRQKLEIGTVAERIEHIYRQILVPAEAAE